MAYLGVDVALKRKGELGSMTEAVAAKQSGERKQKASRQDRNVPPKILDTSAIIDGRIYDVAKTGIIDGRIVIPEDVYKRQSLAICCYRSPCMPSSARSTGNTISPMWPRVSARR